MTARGHGVGGLVVGQRLGHQHALAIIDLDMPVGADDLRVRVVDDFVRLQQHVAGELGGFGPRAGAKRGGGDAERAACGAGEAAPSHPSS